MIHNTVGEILPKVETAEDHTRLTLLTQRFHAVVSHFRHSNLAWERLVKLLNEHGLEEKRLIQVYSQNKC